MKYQTKPNTVAYDLEDLTERLPLEDFLGTTLHLTQSDRKSPAVLMFLLMLEMSQKNHSEGIAWLGKATNWGISLEDGLNKQLKYLLSV